MQVQISKFLTTTHRIQVNQACHPCDTRLLTSKSTVYHQYNQRKDVHQNHSGHAQCNRIMKDSHSNRLMTRRKDIPNQDVCIPENPEMCDSMDQA